MQLPLNWMYGLKMTSWLVRHTDCITLPFRMQSSFISSSSNFFCLKLIQVLPESSIIIHSLKLQFGVLESVHYLLQQWTHRGIAPPKCACRQAITTKHLYYIYIHVHGFSRNSSKYVNILCAGLLVPPGGCWGSSDEGSYSSSRYPLADLCFHADSVLRSRILCPSRLFCSILTVIFAPALPLEFHVCPSEAELSTVGLFENFLKLT